MLPEVVGQWGYLAISVGTYVEGEGVLLSAGALAHAGVLSLPLVVVAATVGSFAWGQTWFALGSVSGERLIARRPAWQPRVRVVERWLVRSGLWVFLFGRFAVGMGTLLPTMIGASGYAWRRFVVLDGIGALIWATSVASVGFGIGAGLRGIVGHSLDGSQWAIAGAAALLLFWLLTRLYKALRVRRSALPRPVELVEEVQRRT